MRRPDRNQRLRFLPAHSWRGLFGLLLLLAAALPATADDSKKSEPTVGTRRALLVCGLPGDDEHRELYAETVEKIYKALVERHGFSADDVRVRFGTESQSGDGPALSKSRGVATREGVESDAAEIKKVLKPEDTLWVIVVGHGHFDGRRSHLNLPGPDISDVEFARLFAGVKAREQVFFITTAVSGFFVRPLSTRGRVVITATEADQEVNETLFPHALAEKLSDPGAEADRDKNGSVSLFELYLAIVADDMQRYVDDELLATEHPQLDDNGDGHGTEIQLDYLPPELGGRPKKTGPPTIGPKDDGALAEKIRVDAIPAK